MNHPTENLPSLSLSTSTTSTSTNNGIYDEIDQQLVYAQVERDINLQSPRKSSSSFSSYHQRSLSCDGKYRSLIVGVCGGSGSGKTTLSREIIRRYGESKVTYISHDYYYKDLTTLTLEQRAKHNFDHPDSLETDLLVEHLKQLQNGDSVEAPVYDFSTHARKNETILLESNVVILVEGILIFTHPELVDLMDIKIFVETPDDIRFIRRLRRDMKDRGRTAESVMNQYLKTVRPMHHTFVEPAKRVADIIIPQGVNPVALDMIISRLRSFAAAQTEEKP